MADFRKWLLAFAMVALSLAVGTPAFAQASGNNFACFVNSGTPVQVRAEGLTELVGDILLQCTGGTPTALGTPVPLYNLTVFLNTNVTSRIINSSTAGMEALVLIDEPYPSATGAPLNSSTTQLYCAAPLNTCAGTPVLGTGGGVGNAGPYAGTAGKPNIFQGVQVSPSSVAWNGLPIDAPGTTGTRIIRITNVRANACALGVSSTLIPTQIVAFIAVNGSQTLTINNPQQAVGIITPGLIGGAGSGTFLQCNNLNPTLVSTTITSGTSAGPITVTAREGFAASFKARGYLAVSPSVIGSPTVVVQNIPGFSYNTESGFVSAATGGTGTGAIGVADTGTRIMVRFANVGAGVSLFAPALINLTLGTSSTSLSGGTAQLVTGADANGNGGSLTTSTSSNVAITVSGTTANVVYEITSSNISQIESIRIPVNVGFISNTANNLPAPGVTTGNVSFAPLSTVATASTTAPIPRFCDTTTAANIFTISACTCDLLFPFVTNQAGFDTGVALANTSLDPFGTTPQTGTTKIFYYGSTTGGGAAPAPQTSQSIPAGSELVFTLSGGGNFGIAATPGFQGYLITVSNFQFCHAFAYISDIGSQKVAEGYLAIQLDLPLLNRTLQAGENEGH